MNYINKLEEATKHLSLNEKFAFLAGVSFAHDDIRAEMDLSPDKKKDD